MENERPPQVRERCDICSQTFDDGLHQNCGGTCLSCMAEAGDPDCIAAVNEIKRGQS